MMLTTTKNIQLTYLDDDQLGPFARAAVFGFLSVGLLIGLGFGKASPISGFIIPQLPLLLFGVVIGIIMLTPRKIIMKIPVSLSVIAFIVWIFFSIGWTNNAEGTRYNLIQDIPLFLGAYLVAGVAALDDIKTGLVWMARATVVLTFIAIIIFPETRLHIDPEAFAGGTYPGWHGFFGHKNILSPILVFALITVLVLDKNFYSRMATALGIVVLLIFSTSGTGLSGAIIAVTFLVWLRIFRDFDARSSSLFMIASIILGVVFLGGLIASLSSITKAYGKDLTFTGRTDIWAAAISFIQERPIQGYGFSGLFWSGTSGASPESYEFWRTIDFRISHVHSGVLDLLIQLGLVGGFLFGVVYLSTFFKAWNVYDKEPDISLWIVTVLVAQVFMSLSESLFLGGWLMILLIFKMVVMRIKSDDTGLKKLAEIGVN